jgi:hypothetical protein
MTDLDLVIWTGWAMVLWMLGVIIFRLFLNSWTAAESDLEKLKMVRRDLHIKILEEECERLDKKLQVIK